MEERPIGPGTVKPIRVVIADDHTLYRQGLRHALQESGLEVMGEASNGRAAAKLVGELRPDVVVMDLHMPVMDGIESARQILADDPAARILILTISTEDQEVLEALRAGASGYVLKSSPPRDVIRAVQAAYDGDSTISPRVAARLLERIREIGEPASERSPRLAALTARELEILRLVAQGKENSEIADELFISPSTAKNHVGRVLEKLDLENRVQAAVYAVRAGLV